MRLLDEREVQMVAGGWFRRDRWNRQFDRPSEPPPPPEPPEPEWEIPEIDKLPLPPLEPLENPCCEPLAPPWGS